MEELEEIFRLTNNEIPEDDFEITVPQMVIGAGYIYQISEKFNIYPELNLSVTFDGKRNTLIQSDFASIDPRIGLESSYKNIIFLRAGINGFQKAATINEIDKWYSSPSIGVGVNFKKVAIDYALNNIGGSTGFHTNSFFIRFGINKRK